MDLLERTKLEIIEQLTSSYTSRENIDRKTEKLLSSSCYYCFLAPENKLKLKISHYY